MHCLIRTVAILSLVALPFPVEAIIHPLAQKLIKQLKPQGLTKKADPQGLQKLEQQAIPILEALESSSRGNGPEPRGLLETAFDFEPIVGHVQEAVIVSNLTRMWELAHQYGCFNEEGKFGKEITRGFHVGKKLTFAYLVPVSRSPEFSRDFSNLRLVVEGSLPPPEAPLDARQLAFAEQLDSIVSEVEREKKQRAFEKGPKETPPPKTNAVGQTMEEHLARWQTEADAAGPVAVQQLPELNLAGRLISSPSKGNGYKWGYSVELGNLSHHPTEVEVVFTMIGTTDFKRQHYVMAERRQKIKLRLSELATVEAWSQPEKTYKSKTADLDGLSKKDKRRKGIEVQYRGTLVEVLHGGRRAAVWSSDPTIAQYLDKESDRGLAARLPNLGGK